MPSKRKMIENTYWIEIAEKFINSNSNYVELFPAEISAPIMASFARAIVVNKLNIEKTEVKSHAELFLLEEELEEINYCYSEFIEAMAEFVSPFMDGKKSRPAIQC